MIVVASIFVLPGKHLILTEIAILGLFAMSLDLLDALHRRWVAFLRALPAAAFARTVKHPDWGVMTLDDLLAQYAWHGRHHIAHVRNALAGRD